MIRILKIVSLILFLPLICLAQNNKPENLRGTLVIEEKPVEFNYLSTLDGTTEIPYFKNLPTQKDYNSGSGKEIVSLQTVRNIEILRFSDTESVFLQNSCKDCLLFKAKITFNDYSGYDEQQVYLAIEYIIWKNTGSADYIEPRVAKLKFLNEINMNEKIK
jgi:hypothetical protein